MKSSESQDALIEEQIQEVLGKLVAAEPSPAFPTRLAETLRAQAVASTAERGYRPRFAGRWRRPESREKWPAVVRVGAAACVVALLMAAGLEVKREDGWKARAGQETTAKVRASTSSRVPNIEGERTFPKGIVGAEAGNALPLGRGLKSPFTSAAGARPARSGAPSMLPARSGPEQNAAADAAAMEDLRTPSYPAPPLPLTAQERRVQLMLRRGEKHDLAQLDAAQNAVFAEQEQIALHNFFEPPKVEIDTTQGASQ